MTISEHVCEYCRKSTPFLKVRESDFEAILKVLSNGSKTLAASELKHFAQCSDSEAGAWIDHLLDCMYAWPLSEADEEVLRAIDNAFAHVPKPEHFTNYMHCDECEEHDNTLRGRTRETLRRQDLGNVGWDPISFTNPEGIGYLFPALARYALLPNAWRDHDWYACQLLLHLSKEYVNNGFLAWCAPQRREAVYSLLEHLAATRLSGIEDSMYQRELRASLSAWRYKGS